jgi:hypothetical protein
MPNISSRFRNLTNHGQNSVEIGWLLGDVSFCKISIYVTDKDESANRKLLEKIQGLGLYQTRAIHFCHPDLSEMLLHIHTLGFIDKGRGARRVIRLGLFWFTRPFSEASPRQDFP